MNGKTKFETSDPAVANSLLYAVSGDPDGRFSLDLLGKESLAFDVAGMTGFIKHLAAFLYSFQPELSCFADCSGCSDADSTGEGCSQPRQALIFDKPESPDENSGPCHEIDIERLFASPETVAEVSQ